MEKSNSEKESHSLIEINIDLITELRSQGKFNEAEELILAFRKSCKDNKKQLQKEISSQLSKIDKLMPTSPIPKKIIKGICSKCGSEYKKPKKNAKFCGTCKDDVDREDKLILDDLNRRYPKWLNKRVELLKDKRKKKS